MLSPSSTGEQHHQSEPFLSATDLSEHRDVTVIGYDDALTAGQAWCLYLSHFLSMWNSRTYEYGAILFIQAAFPGNLLPSSINGIAETVCVLVSSSYLGLWVDRASTRLRPLLLTIFVNRIALVLCCLLWVLLFYTTQDVLKKVLFSIVLLLGMVEKASRMTNNLSMERDWTPILANAEGVDYDLTHMNTAMRRIDIACKFTAPLAISSVVALMNPTRAAATIAIVSSVSVVVESSIVMTVWRHNSRLQVGKDHKQMTRFSGPATRVQSNHANFAHMLLTKGYELLRNIREVTQANISGLRYYFSTAVWLPSICVAVLHGSVLAWSGTLITWLLNEHFSLAEVTIAKGVGAIFEIGSTLVFPWAVGMLLGTGSRGQTTSYQMVGQRNIHDDDGGVPSHDHEELTDKLDEDVAEHNEFLGGRTLHVAVIRVAYWSITALSLFLVPTMIALFILNHSIKASETPLSEEDQSSPLSASTATAIAAITFWSFLSLSFLGRWTYDLAATQLTQMLVPSSHRATFGGTEQAIVSVVSLVHWVAAAIWHQQSDFIWLALASAIGVGFATILYVRWARVVGLKE